MLQIRVSSNRQQQDLNEVLRLIFQAGDGVSWRILVQSGFDCQLCRAKQEAREEKRQQGCRLALNYNLLPRVFFLRGTSSLPPPLGLPVLGLHAKMPSFLSP